MSGPIGTLDKKKKKKKALDTLYKKNTFMASAIVI